MKDKRNNLRTLRKENLSERKVSMLTCYDYQMATLLNETELDLILVGDSLGNVVLGLDTTIQVTPEQMILFTSAVVRGAPNKFVIVDIPFGVTNTFEKGVLTVTEIFQKTAAQAVKIEGADHNKLQIIERLVSSGIPVMGHIGLMPQSVHGQGGYYTHGKTDLNKKRLLTEAQALQEAGAFALVLECIDPIVAKEITDTLNILTIGIGSGDFVGGQVLVSNDLLKNGKHLPPSFCEPLVDLYEIKKEAVNRFIAKQNTNTPGNKYVGINSAPYS